MKLVFVWLLSVKNKQKSLTEMYHKQNVTFVLNSLNMILQVFLTESYQFRNYFDYNHKAKIIF